MSKEVIHVSLSEFMKFVNKSGMAKATVVSSSKLNRMDDYVAYKDYWLKFRDAVVKMHKKDLDRERLYDVVEQVLEERQDNYNEAIKGYLSYIGKKKLVWSQPPKAKWEEGQLSVEINPEVSYFYKGKKYVIKLFLFANDSLDKRHANLILNVMEMVLRSKVEDDTVFAVLDVKRGKAFTSVSSNPKTIALLKAEALSFASLWNSL